MAKTQEADTVRLVDAKGVTVTVSAEKADRLLAGTGYTKAPTRRSAKPSDSDA